MREVYILTNGNTPLCLVTLQWYNVRVDKGLLSEGAIMCAPKGEKGNWYLSRQGVKFLNNKGD